MPQTVHDKEKKYACGSLHTYFSATRGPVVRALAERILEKACRLAQANSLSCVCDMREGRAANEILKAAEEHECDVMVIGSRGLSGVKRVTMGETGNEVALQAPHACHRSAIICRTPQKGQTLVWNSRLPYSAVF